MLGDKSKWRSGTIIASSVAENGKKIHQIAYDGGAGKYWHDFTDKRWKALPSSSGDKAHGSCKHGNGILSIGTVEDPFAFGDEDPFSFSPERDDPQPRSRRCFLRQHVPQMDAHILT